MNLSNLQKNKHLLSRAGFGLKPEHIGKLSTLNTANLYEEIEKKGSTKPVYIEIADNSVKGLLMGFAAVGDMMKDEAKLTQEQKKEIAKKSIDELKNLNLAWLEEMVYSEAQLLEKLSLFWHGHFACRNLNVYYQQLLLQEIRTHAFGSFKDLLKAVSKSAAMIFFLNNLQNKKDHPNENFAREVMELFTLGRGHYTEHDVKEAARAFTGWSTTIGGEYIFRPYLHDNGEKEFLGHSGKFKGDDILDILLEQKQTAIFITQKIYRFFVNSNPDDEKVQWLAERFYTNDYNIKLLMRDLFTSEWFYDEKNIACMIKSPVELIAGMRRMLQINFTEDAPQLFIQKILGQQLFYPQNVAGWPGGTNWIDSSSLMFRMRLPQLLKSNEAISIDPKSDDDVQMGKSNSSDKGLASKPGFQLRATINWTNYLKQFDNKKLDDVYYTIEATLLQTMPGSISRKTVESAEYDSVENYIKNLTIAFMSTPEFQLC